MEGAVIDVEQPLGGGEVAVESTQVDETAEPEGGAQEQQQKPEEKQDGRRTPDAYRKYLAEQKRAADAVADPEAKKAILDNIRGINDLVGKARGYEEVYPTVREARETRAAMESFGGIEGIQKLQESAAAMEQLDAKLAAGDPTAIDELWDTMKAGMSKLLPTVIDKFAKDNPEGYGQFISHRAVQHFDSAGFPQAFDQMYQAFKAGNTQEAETLAQRMIDWYTKQRDAQAETKKTDPEVERLRKELDQRTQTDQQQKVEAAYKSVVAHAGPEIDKHLKPMVAKLGLSKDQYDLLRQDVWSDLQKTRNADATYKTVSTAKYKQSPESAAEYIKQQTVARAKASAEKMAKLRYGHQLKAGTQTAKANPTQPPVNAGVIRGEMPSVSEIDYGPKGKETARKAGYRSVGDMVLDGKAPLTSGVIRQWR